MTSGSTEVPNSSSAPFGRVHFHDPEPLPDLMKYSLRSLMVGITLFCVLLGGRIEYLRRMAAYHEREAERCARELGMEVDPVTFPIMFVQNSNPNPIRDESREHVRLALDYRDATYRPWTIVNDWRFR